MLTENWLYGTSPGSSILSQRRVRSVALTPPMAWKSLKHSPSPDEVAAHQPVAVETRGMRCGFGRERPRRRGRLDLDGSDMNADLRFVDRFDRICLHVVLG